MNATDGLINVQSEIQKPKKSKHKHCKVSIEWFKLNSTTAYRFAHLPIMDPK